MVDSINLSDLDIDYILSLPEVDHAKKCIDSQREGSIYFDIPLTTSLREILLKKFCLDFSQINTIPMRWIKGDISPHIDRSVHVFNKTYLAYLTDSPGQLMVDGTSYPITKGNAYVFSEGLSHETIGTGSVPRLLLGPMSENGISVGAGIYLNPGEIAYLRQFSGNLQYSTDQTTWVGLPGNSPIYLLNQNPAGGCIYIYILTDITISDTNNYFICQSDNIQFGSSSLNENGLRPTIKISVNNYDGLISNGEENTPGYNNIYIYNIIVDGGIYQTQIGAGWIGKKYFGNQAFDNYIVNCSSSGTINNGSGGIVGSYSGSGTGSSSSSSLYIYGCSSYGFISINSGGIVGSNGGSNGGYIMCKQSWSTAFIGKNSGGIFGTYAGLNGGNVQAINCYSLSPINQYGGGIFGSYAGDNGFALAQNCYSRGDINTDGGGIFGSFAGNNGGQTPAINCYASGIFSIPGTGIYGSNAVDDSPHNCYFSNGNWSSVIANSNLTGTPNPFVGTTWTVYIPDQPYELNNVGYTPYKITNISSSHSLIQTYSTSFNSGDSSTSALISGKSYIILQISGGNPFSYETITIDSDTGSITTTGKTLPGVYTIYIRNTGNYDVSSFSLAYFTTSFNLTILDKVVPNVSICFPAGTPVLTDQGEISIEKIQPKKNTIRGKEIIAITESIPLDSYLICMERNSLGPNIPNKRIICTKDHKVMCDNKMMRAEYLIQYMPGVYKIQYNKERLYNVLLKEHSTMSINNLVVETMNPGHILAKIYSGNYTPEQKNNLIKMLNHYNIKQRSKLFIRNNIFRA